MSVFIYAYQSPLGYVVMKVRRVTKNVCKLHMKRVRLNKVAQHEKKYLLNCSVRIYQRTIKLKYRAIKSVFINVFL